MQFEIDNKKAIANRGNLFRLKQVMRRAEAGEPVKVGFIGGSHYDGMSRDRAGALLRVSCV